MKTAEEWSREYWKLKQNPPSRVDGKTPSMHEWDILVQQIQLDAMKEGMRRAANKVSNVNERPSYPEDVNYRSGMKWMRGECEQAILTAAEQLTEKDLV